MRERLIELLRSNNAAPEKTCPRFGTGESCEGCKYLTDDIGCDYIARQADYLLANGVIVPPCKVGDTVYRISTKSHSRLKYIQETTISRIAIDNEGIWLFCSCNPITRCIFGKTVFLTREEAEAVLVNYESSKNEKGR